MSIKDFAADFDARTGLALGECKADDSAQAKAQGMCGGGLNCAGGGGRCSYGSRCSGN